jgi:hypothetical protein
MLLLSIASSMWSVYEFKKPTLKEKSASMLTFFIYDDLTLNHRKLNNLQRLNLAIVTNILFTRSLSQANINNIIYNSPKTDPRK